MQYIDIDSATVVCVRTRERRYREGYDTIDIILHTEGWHDLSAESCGVKCFPTRPLEDAFGFSLGGEAPTRFQWYSADI